MFVSSGKLAHVNDVASPTRVTSNVGSAASTPLACVHARGHLVR